MQQALALDGLACHVEAMARTAQKRKASRKRKTPGRSARAQPVLRTIWWWASRSVLGILVVALVAIALGAVIRPLTTPYIVAEGFRGAEIRRTWTPMDRIAPTMARAAVAAEDANFCLHWGFDMAAIRDALEEGAQRGASTLSQQVTKNVYLWHGRSWGRKALEAAMTPLVEMFWSKRRIVEVYLNVAEFDRGVFGVEAAAQHYFGVSAADLSDRQAALLAAVLPDPKGRSAREPSAFVRQRAARIADGAATIAADGRARCFES